MTALATIPALIPSQIDSQDQLIESWLSGRSPHTIRAYRATATAFIAHLAGMGLTIRNATVPAVQAFAAALVARGLSAASQARAIAAVKSLLNYAHRLGFTPFNAAPAVRLPRIKDRLAERHPGGRCRARSTGRAQQPARPRHRPPSLFRRAAHRRSRRVTVGRPAAA